ncbi:putative peroxisomal membrane protein pex16 [Phaeomoniella chlamydospora]|uniref:Peroxisomal membrane protein PEX16 n=1 Tax=Phaeomoniella chlamydospora TaxID=158046 RepID=A0A0G2H0J2_PHACM|nr:putative peroxisomal membrane protein pex16 [Phaeomoniella chlamydospora]
MKPNSGVASPASSYLSLPPNLLKKYNALILSNPSTVSQVESTLRSLTYFLPGARLHDSELASESIYTLTNLLSLYHDTILARSPAPGALSKVDPHAKYAKFWMNRSRLYTYLARLLKTVQYTELLWEMVGRRKGGERGRWRTVVFLESVKAILRLCLCWVTGGRWVLSSPLPDREDIKEIQSEQPERDINEWLENGSDPFHGKNDHPTRWENGLATPPLSDNEKLPNQSSQTHSRTNTPPSSSYSPTSSFVLPRTNITLPALPTSTSISTYLSEKTLFPSSIRLPATLVHRLTSSQSQLAELLYILRPLIFAILMSRAASRHVPQSPEIPSQNIGRPSWKRGWMPWVIGIGLDWGSQQLMKRDIERRVPGGLRGLSDVEKEEFKKRRTGLGWWIMRGAFYENFTRYVATLLLQTSPSLPYKS